MAKQGDGPAGEGGGRGGAPTPQGPKSAGPGNAHGVPPEDSPDDSALDRLRPLPPEQAQPAADPEAMAERVLKGAQTGPKAKGDAGPLGVAKRDED